MNPDNALVWGTVLALLCFALAASQYSCSPPVIMPPQSLQIWTDDPSEPDPIEECQAVTKGKTRCLTMTAEAWAYWNQLWIDCETRMEAEE